MPDLNSLPVPNYAAGQPYHYEYDNLPLNTLAARDELINNAVDKMNSILQDTAGTQGTLANRLNQSIDADGDLRASAIDEALHNIAEHSDGSKTVSGAELLVYQQLGIGSGGAGYPSISNPVPFVRMLEAERDKLALIADEATNLAIDVVTPSLTYSFGVTGMPQLNLVDSTTIEWNYAGSNNIRADLKLSSSFAHRHYYDIEPPTANYLNFDVNSVSTPYIEGSLRVYINGVRLSSVDSVYVPNSTHTAYSLNKFSPSHTTGEFTLDNAISASDIIRVDFDVAVSW